MRIQFCLGILASLLGLVCLSAARLPSGSDQDSGRPFRLSSSTFDNNTTLPISAIHNIIIPNGSNGCSIDGSPGGNESRELSWTRPRGPCPPPNFPPNVHHYVFTVYALDIMLDLPSSPNFPATPETLFQALIQAGENKHILESASITGLYSTTPPQ